MSAASLNLGRSQNCVSVNVLKEVADKNSNVSKMMTLVFDRVENMVEKRGNASKQYFIFLFQQFFQKVSYSDPFNLWIVFLTCSLIHHFETVPISKKLQMTPKMWLLKDFKYRLHRKHWKKGEIAHSD